MDEGMALRKEIESTVKNYIKKNLAQFSVVSVGISNRHIHLSKEHLKILFGERYSMNELFRLSQTGQYAAKEVVTLIGRKGIIEGVRILGPARAQTQVEVLMSDTFKLGTKAPVRDSGDLHDTPGITILGPCGVVSTNFGVIVAKRHIHLSCTEAQLLRLGDKDEVRVRIGGDRGLVYDKVLIRVHSSFNAEFHVDMDEANAAGLKKGDLAYVEK
jgi:putative phosphotransacetylase